MSDATRPTGAFDENPDRGSQRREDITGHGTTAGPVGATGGSRETHAAQAAPVPPVTPVTPATHGTHEAQAPGHGVSDASRASEPTSVASKASKAPTASHPAPLLPHEETDQLASRMRHAVSGFVDGPRSAVEEADQTLEEIAARFSDAVTQRRRTLRMSWQETDEGRTTTADTEQLRLALRDYRELADRLLHQ
ncbi:hypothetical protein [Streptomyces broussonetiae]|uniref:Uncharacterized protein n=1 Tax=Streptomyces broussonetiae TaxID=2686304 RepID=A0ABV5E2Y3_9ACTN